MDLSQFSPQCIFEIGVGNPSISRIHQYLGTAVKLVLFEPNPQTFRQLVAAFGHHSNVTIHNVALYDRDGEIEFAMDGDSSFSTEVFAPTVYGAPTEYVESRPKVRVPCHTLNHYDQGQIDVALIDTEGCEWKVLDHMVSRPRLIVLETHMSAYKTPNLDLIEKWMADNGYRLDQRDASDSLYIKI